MDSQKFHFSTYSSGYRSAPADLMMILNTRNTGIYFSKGYATYLDSSPGIALMENLWFKEQRLAPKFPVSTGKNVSKNESF